MMESRWKQEKLAVLTAAREMAAQGLVTGTSGNVSMRLPLSDDDTELIAVTPSSIPYSTMTEGDIVVADFGLEPIEGDSIPSSESQMHIAIYESRPDANAVIHTHSVFASVAAVAGTELPAIIDEAVIAIGGTVNVSEYAFPGSQELADNVRAALGERNAALIRNHGVVGVGRSLQEALEICSLVERVAQIFYYASLSGNVNLLPDDIVQSELAIFRMRQQTRE